MLSKNSVSIIGLVSQCLVVSMSLQCGLFSAFNEEPCTVNLALRNFRLILSWELRNKSTPPTQYTVLYTVMSKNETSKVVKNCANITESSCDVTGQWNDTIENYVPIILVYRRDSMANCCAGSVLLTDAVVEPPDFEIVGFMDHIEVIVKFPPVIPKIYEETLREILSYTQLVIKEQTGNSIKMHEPKMTNVYGNFTYVLTDLLPKTNYCVSVYFDKLGLETEIKAPLKCTLFQPDKESGSSEFAKVGVITGCLIVVVFIGTIIVLKRIGYICLRNNFPNVLKFRYFLAWVVLELPPSEAVSRLEVIPTNKKKKLWNYEYGDESGSDDEEVPKASATGYTMHGLMSKLQQQASDSPGNPGEPQLEEDSGAEECDEAEAGAGAEPELLTEAELGPCLSPSEAPSDPYERRGCVREDSFPGEDSSSMDGPEDTAIFNVDLNSVFLRVLHDDAEDTSELLSLTEDTVLPDEGPHRTESGLLMAGGDRTQLPHPSLSSQGLWTEDGSSERTDTSDSDADVGDGYIMR
ncbi:interferon alpha/beta receptor 2 [Acomys russatus]|uniref:interferon alpha/beta receptor 2 n=1 Tax=Acomys russatus TaxID=60746 RepID=UPI0021E1DD79|nr:interferon alpha/beta receptor 2 [Acomys russatus]